MARSAKEVLLQRAAKLRRCAGNVERLAEKLGDEMTDEQLFMVAHSLTQGIYLSGELAEVRYTNTETHSHDHEDRLRAGDGVPADSSRGHTVRRDHRCL